MSETNTARSRRRAGGRSPFRVDADHGPLVPARRRAPDRGHPRRARLGLGRRGLPRPDAALPRPAVHDLGRRPDPEPRDESQDGEPDHPLRGGAAKGLSGQRAHARPAARPQSRSAAVVSAGQGKNVSPLVEITVDASAGHKAEKAANSLANTVIGSVSTYVDQKIALLNKQIASSKAELADINTRISNAVAQQQAVINDKTISSTDKLIAISTYNNTISFSEQRRGTVQQELFQNQQLLSLAENVEKSKIVQPAVASKTTATSRRNAALIGALIGLLLGALAAAVADPFLQRRAARSAA